MKRYESNYGYRNVSGFNVCGGTTIQSSPYNPLFLVEKKITTIQIVDAIGPKFDRNNETSNQYREGFPHGQFGIWERKTIAHDRFLFDTIKIHMQTQENKTLWQCTRRIMKKEGVQGYFNGISAPLVGSMAENALLFLAYNQIQNAIRMARGKNNNYNLSIAELSIAGGLSGALVSFVLTPIELVKCRMQTQAYLEHSRKKLFTSSLAVLLHTFRKRGITGLYQGHTCTLMREMAGGVAWFGIYEYAVERMIESTPFATRKSDLTPWQLMGAGALAGMGYNAALYPADVVKSRIQSGLHGKDRFIKVAHDIYQKFGFRFFFRGFGITVARSAPSSGVIFLTYEWLNQNLGHE